MISFTELFRKIMKRPEGTTAKGTTTLGFIFRGGIILGVDSRITNVNGDVISKQLNLIPYFYLHSLNHQIFTIKSYSLTIKYSVSDDQRKYFELSSTRPIICTFTGSVDDWYSMYEDVRKKVIT